MSKSKIDQLKGDLEEASVQKDLAKDRFLAKKKELIEAESQLVDAREKERAIKDKLQAYQNEFEIEHSLDDERDREISSFKERMPAAFEKIKNEAPIAPVSSLTLGTLKNDG